MTTTPKAAANPPYHPLRIFRVLQITSNITVTLRPTFTQLRRLPPSPYSPPITTATPSPLPLMTPPPQS
ncbi:hypothetical protein [Anabaena azotica]|uniref:hypothetical protein n=1 Tax=Anabaena azotica TaxID=197653 RepID=UPI0016847EA6|nr:hypothetical protein [Anabaena azotica]